MVANEIHCHGRVQIMREDRLPKQVMTLHEDRRERVDQELH